MSRTRNTDETQPLRIIPGSSDPIWKQVPYEVIDQMIQYVNDAPKGKRL
jgi:hypothetical protein